MGPETDGGELRTATPRVLLRAKLTVPVPHRNLVPRPRLVTAIDGAVSSPVTLVCAPAGYGKTTVLSRWAARAKCPVAWLSLDASDNDLVRFWTYVTAALRGVVPTLGTAILAELDNVERETATPFLDALLAELGDVPRDFVLVIDDYHFIESPEIDRALAYFIAHMSPMTHLVVSSRTVPAIGVSRLRARRQLTEFTAADLGFTPVETADFFSRPGTLRLTAEEIEQLHARTEGWVAGLQLIALSLERCKSPLVPSGEIAGLTRPVYEYLIEEVLGEQPPGVQQFMLETSILDPLSPRLCAAVLGESEAEAAEMLELLERRNLFLVALDDRAEWYRYHQLLAEVLESRFRQREPERARLLFRRASDWYEQHGLLEEAVQMARRGEDFEQIAKIVLAHRVRLQMQDELPVVLRWMNLLPEEYVRCDPQLSVAIALPLGTTGRYALAEGYLDTAEHLLLGDAVETSASPEVRDRLGEVVATRALIESIRVSVGGDRTHVRELCERAMDLLGAERHYLRGMLLQTSAACQGSDLTQWRATLLRAVEEQAPLGIRNLTVSAKCNLARVEARLGDLRAAARTADEAIGMYTDDSAAEHPMLAMAYLELGKIYYEWDRLDEAYSHLTTGLRISAHSRITLDVAEAHIALAQTFLARGDADAALAALREAMDASRTLNVPVQMPTSTLRLWASIGRAELLRMNDAEIDEALSADRLQDVYTICSLQTTCALQYMHGEIEEAAYLVAQLVAKIDPSYRRCSLQTHVLGVLVHMAQDDTEAALAALGCALEIGEPEGYVRVFVDEGAPMMKALQLLRRKTPPTPYTETLVAALARVRGFKLAEPGASVGALTDREIELVRLIASGLTTREIAQQLVISIETVRTHLTNINSKLQVHSRIQAVERARDLNLI